MYLTSSEININYNADVFLFAFPNVLAYFRSAFKTASINLERSLNHKSSKEKQSGERNLKIVYDFSLPLLIRKKWVHPSIALVVNQRGCL